MHFVSAMHPHKPQAHCSMPCTLLGIPSLPTDCPTCLQCHPDAPLKLRIHNSSVLARVRPATVVFASAAQGDSGWYEMQGVTAIDAQWLTELAPHMFGRGGRD